jgi:hypothetical protein
VPLEETVYSARDNTIELVLTVDGAPIDHTAITKVELYFETFVVDSDSSPSAFALGLTDRIVLKLGVMILSPGRYAARIVTYDALHAMGLVWGTLILHVKPG